MAIFFYSTYEKFGFLSNFSPYGFYARGIYWRTSEHYYQKQKFTNLSIINAIRSAQTPLDAAIIAHKNNNEVKDEWLNIRDKAMYAAIHLKFSQNQDINIRLQETRFELLVENAWDDYYWGCGLTRSGCNRLGKILMYYRDIGYRSERFPIQTRLYLGIG